MQSTQSKLTSQGQVSVPAAVRRFLHLIPGSVLVWTQDGERIVVGRDKRYNTDEVHRALFPDPPTGPEQVKTLAELRQGIRQRMQKSHARD